MKYNNQAIVVPSWISCRTYFFGQEKSRTYISNEKNHTFVMLEGLASDMWQILAEGKNESSLIDWAKKNNIDEQVEGFLLELSAQELICCGESSSHNQAGYEEMTQSSAEEEMNFISEMQNWFFENRLMFSVFFELTYRCDLKCVHCYNPKNMSSVELDFEQCKRAIDDAYDCGCFKITFSGGESTLHTRFLELVSYARSKRMSVEIFSNGQSLKRNCDLYKKVLEFYPYRVCVSLYSTEKEMHERVTSVEGSFENTFSLVKDMRARNVNVQIKNFLLNFNCMDCIKVKAFAKGIGATSVADISLIPTIEGNKKTLQYALDEDTLFKLFTDSESPFYLGKDYEPRKKIDMDYTPCLGGYTGVCINPNGEVVICVSMPYSVGNLNKTSLKEIWQRAANKDIESRLYQWQRVTYADFTECFKEEYCKFCQFCPGMGYLENGHLKKSSVLCMQAKSRMKAYNYLQAKSNN